MSHPCLVKLVMFDKILLFNLFLPPYALPHVIFFITHFLFPTKCLHVLPLSCIFISPSQCPIPSYQCLLIFISDPSVPSCNFRFQCPNLFFNFYLSLPGVPSCNFTFTCPTLFLFSPPTQMSHRSILLCSCPTTTFYYISYPSVPPCTSHVLPPFPVFVSSTPPPTRVPRLPAPPSHVLPDGGIPLEDCV